MKHYSDTLRWRNQKGSCENTTTQCRLVLEDTGNAVALENKQWKIIIYWHRKERCEDESRWQQEQWQTEGVSGALKEVKTTGETKVERRYKLVPELKETYWETEKRKTARFEGIKGEISVLLEPIGDRVLLPLWPGRHCFGWFLAGFGRSGRRQLLIKVVGEEVEGRVGEVGQPVRWGVRAATWRLADLLGGRDSDDWPLPGQKGGQKGGLGWGTERRGDGRCGGGRDRGRAVAGCWTWFSPIPLLVLFYVLPSGGDGDGLDSCSVNDGWKMPSRAGTEEWIERIKWMKSLLGSHCGPHICTSATECCIILTTRCVSQEQRLTRQRTKTHVILL